MLLNVSHEITNCGLPQHVQERYIRYKQGNRAIVAWMTRYGPEKYKKQKVLPIKQMVALGRLLCNKVSELGTLPSDVDYYFKEVIKERAYLSQHFRSHRDKCERDEVDTINHEHFTESLKQIHRILLTAGKPSTRAKPASVTQKSHRSSSSASSSSELNNTFSGLLLSTIQAEPEYFNSDDDSSSNADTDATSECSHTRTASHDCACDADEAATDFLDVEGKVGVAVESIIFVSSIHKIAEAVRSCWIKAGQGDASVTASAAYTNLLLTHAINHVRNFHLREPGLPTATQIQERLDDVSCGGHDESVQSQQAIYQSLHALAQIEQSFSKLSSRSSQGPSSTSSQEDTLVETLISDLGAVYRDRGVPSLALNGLVFIQGSNIIRDDPCDSTAMLTICTTLYLLSVSHCAYSSRLAKATFIAVPRISALKMANEALSSIRCFIDDKSIFPCQCINTLGYRIVQMRSELESFAKYKCWNALMQSPHVAGNHCLEIIDLCSYYGMHLLHYRQYVAAIMHSYQALVQLKQLDKIPILEEVFDLLMPVLYSTGSRPESGFMASWLRYIGARLKFRKGKKYQNHKDSWCMAVPAHAAASSAGLNIDGKNDEIQIQSKFDFGKIDYVTRMKHERWILSEEKSILLDYELEPNLSNGLEDVECGSQRPDAPPVLINKANRTRHKRNKSCNINKTCDRPNEEACLKLDHNFSECFIVAPDRARNLPSSRINLISFFYSMATVVSGISDTTHADDDKSSRDSGRGQMCLCFVQTIIRAADRVIDVRRRSGVDAKGATLSKNEKECIECYKEHLMKMLKDAKVLENGGGKWLWASI